MSTQDSNGAAPAFPIPRDGHYTRKLGLTKREYAAIEMAKGMLSNPDYAWADHVDVLRDDALRQADALLEALSEPPASPSPTEGEARKVLENLVKALDEGTYWDKWLDPLEAARAFLSQSKGGGSDE